MGETARQCCCDWRPRSLAKQAQGLGNELRLQLTEVADEETVTREMIERQITRLQNLAHSALPIIEMLTRFREAQSGVSGSSH